MSANALEKYIKMNTHFVNEQYKAVVGIFVLNNYIFQELEKHLTTYGLTYAQFNILRILKGQYPTGVPLPVFKERMLHKQSDVSRLVDRLVALDLVEKRPHETNKRKMYVHLTDSGLNLVQSIDIRSDEFKSILKNIPEDKVVLFNQVVSDIIDLMPND